MNTAQLVFMGAMTALGVIVVLALLFTNLADYLPTDPRGKIVQK